MYVENAIRVLYRLGKKTAPGLIDFQLTASIAGLGDPTSSR